MAKQRKNPESTEAETTVKTEWASASVKVTAPVAPKPAPAKTGPTTPELRLSFDRYFVSLGKPSHHKEGMRKFLPPRAIKGKRTVADWDALFVTY